MAGTKKITTVTDTITCTRCGVVTKDAYVSKSDLHKFLGRLSICKNCVEEIYNELFQKYGDHKKAIYYMCRKFDMPFTYNTYSGALKEANKKGWSIYQAYFKQLNSLGSINKTGSCFDDSDEWVSENDNDCISGTNYTVTEEDLSFWGRGFSKDEYEFLNGFFEEYIMIYEHDTPVQINIYKNVAKTQLQANKALEQGDITSYSKLVKTISDLHNDGNIKPVQETGANANDQMSFGLFIKKWENEKPVPKTLDDEMKKYIDTFMVGQLAKMEGINNELVSQYQDSIDEYTVDFNGIDDEEDDDT